MKTLKIIVLAILLVIVIAAVAYSDNSSSISIKDNNEELPVKHIKRAYDNAIDAFYNAHYKRAVPSLEFLVDYDPLNANYNYHLGLCLVSQDCLNEKALEYFKVAELNVSRITIDSFREERAPVEVYYYIGFIYHNMEDYQNAEYYYEKYKAKLRKSEKELIYGVDYLIKLSQLEKEYAYIKNIE